MMDFLKKLNAPKVIKGQSGDYWQIAANDDESAMLFARVNFQAMPGFTADGTPRQMGGTQVNLMFMGDDDAWIPEPFKRLDQRPYEWNGKTTPGWLIAKIWVPLGEYQSNLKLLLEAAHDKASPVLEKAVSPVIDALSLEARTKFSQIFEFLMEKVIPPEAVEVAEVKAYINDEMQEFAKEWNQKSKDKIDGMKAKAAPAPDNTPPAPEA